MSAFGERTPQSLPRRQGSGFANVQLDEDLEGEWWPPPLSEQDVAVRKRAARLLEALRKIPSVYYDIKAWENEHEETFCLFRKGCLDGANSEMLEAPIYNNRQIEDAWLFLFEIRRRHFVRRKHVQECAKILGASYCWSMVLFGSTKIHESLKDLPDDVRYEVLEDANALRLLAIILPAPQPTMPSRGPPELPMQADTDWAQASWPQGSQATDWAEPKQSSSNPFAAPSAAADWSQERQQSSEGFPAAPAQWSRPASGRPATNPFRNEGGASVPASPAGPAKATNPFKAQADRLPPRGPVAEAGYPSSRAGLRNGGVAMNSGRPNDFPDWSTPVRQAVR